MATQLQHLWPARVAINGHIAQKMRTLVYETASGLRAAWIDSNGILIEDVALNAWQVNGQGADVDTADGRHVSFLPDGGCSSCGGSLSQATAAALLASV